MKNSKTRHANLVWRKGNHCSKPKYSLITDSAEVPWGKGEKYLEVEEWKEPEIECLQAVGAIKIVTTYLLYNGSAS